MGEINVAAKVTGPYSTEDCEQIDALCERLLEACEAFREASTSCHAKSAASDLIDLIVDIKIDVREYGKKHAGMGDADDG